MTAEWLFVCNNRLAHKKRATCWARAFELKEIINLSGYL